MCCSVLQYVRNVRDDGVMRLAVTIGSGDTAPPGVMECIGVCCSVVQRVAVCWNCEGRQCAQTVTKVYHSISWCSKSVVVWCSVSQCVAACISVREILMPKYLYMYIFMYVRRNKCTYIHTNVYIHTHICVYTYIYIERERQREREREREKER